MQIYQQTCPIDIVRTVTGSDIITVTDDIILANATSANIALSLPLSGAMVKSNTCIVIKKIDSSANIVIVSCIGGDTVDGAASVTLSNQYDSYTLQADGHSAWAIVGHTVTAAGTVGMGALDGQAKVAAGATITGGLLYLQTADATEPGLISTGAQTFAGDKVFTGAVTASNLSGTNTGDQTNIAGNAATATKLAVARSIAVTGDLAYTSPGFDGSGNITGAGTLATVNASPGSFTNASITVDAKGRVTTAASGGAGGATVHAFRAEVSVVQNLASAAEAVVQYNNKIFDTDNAYNAGTYIHTPSVSGYYNYNASVYVSDITASGSSVSIRLYKNGLLYVQKGSTVPYAPATVAQTPDMAAVRCVAYMNGTTDTMEVRVSGNTSEAYPRHLNALGSACFFEGYAVT